MYEVYLEVESIEYSDLVFKQFLYDYGNLCPSGGVVTYVHVKVQCSIHSEIDDEETEEDDEESVPFL